jgi:membrane dipeptidase
MACVSEPRIVDTHNDLLLELEYRRGEERPFERHWLPNLERGGVALQVCPIFSATLDWLPELALRHNLQQVAAFRRAVTECSERVVEVRSRGDLDEVEAGTRIGLMLSMEGVEALGYDPTLVDVFHDLGVRMVSLTWNRRNPFGDGAAEPAHGGLSNLGRALVDRMAGLGGIAIDLVHTSERTFWDIVEQSGSAPLVVSHAACRAVCETPRNLNDEQLKALAERGGVLGLMLLPIVIDPESWTMERVLDHVDHAVSVMGIEHVGLGGDFIRQVWRALPMRAAPDSLLPGEMPMDAAIEGLAGPEDYPTLVEALRGRGYEGERLEAILGGNMFRLLRSSLPE